jgi:phage baseplate assembly protein W|tara:strand:+ start:773 stop:1192 length:420 start_codon:yes stop_codon:yes gene_type:complete
MSKVGLTTEVTTTQNFYSDLFNDFSRHAQTGELNKKINENAVKQSVRNLLLTNKGERLFQPTVGSNLKALLFENATPFINQMLHDYILETIENHEPRAEFLYADLSFDHDRNSATVDVTFMIINTGVQATLPLFIERTR